jgi:isoleucyl-tRNA synthetase
MEDVRIGDEIVKGQADAYRKIRNTMRYLLGNLEGFTESEKMPVADMPELEQWVLHRLSELDTMMGEKANTFDFNPIFRELYQFCIMDLSVFYFDIRKDALYCDNADTPRRRAARTVLDAVFNRLVLWFAPVLSFTAEEVWQSRFGPDADSVHRQIWPATPAEWQNDALAEKWSKIREVRGHVTAAIELMRRDKIIGSSLQAEASVTIADQSALDAFSGLDAAEIFITSNATLSKGDADDVTISVASGDKCERCWVILPEVTENGELCNRCADAVAKHDSKAD